MYKEKLARTVGPHVNCGFGYDLHLHLDAHFVQHDASEMQPREQQLHVLGQPANVTPHLGVSSDPFRIQVDKHVWALPAL